MMAHTNQKALEQLQLHFFFNLTMAGFLAAPSPLPCRHKLRPMAQNYDEVFLQSNLALTS